MMMMRAIHACPGPYQPLVGHSPHVSRRRTLVTPRAANVTYTEKTRASNDSCITLAENLFLRSCNGVHADGKETTHRSWTLLCATLLAAGMLTIPCEGAWAVGDGLHHTSMYDLAENEDFWANVLRYVSYFFSVLLGTAYVAFKPILELLKRPTTAVLVIGAAAGLYYFVSTTVTAMLGVNEYGYEPSSIVTPYIN